MYWSLSTLFPTWKEIEWEINKRYNYETDYIICDYSFADVVSVLFARDKRRKAKYRFTRNPPGPHCHFPHQSSPGNEGADYRRLSAGYSSGYSLWENGYSRLCRHDENGRRILGVHHSLPALVRAIQLYVRSRQCACGRPAERVCPTQCRCIVCPVSDRRRMCRFI